MESNNKYREAITRIQVHNKIFSQKEYFTEYMTEALDLAISSLERQVAKKPYMIAMDSFAFNEAATLCCPTCKNSVINYYSRKMNPPYCMMCGQKLDWSGAR